MDNKSEEVLGVTLMKEKTIEKETMKQEKNISSEPLSAEELKLVETKIVEEVKSVEEEIVGEIKPVEEEIVGEIKPVEKIETEEIEKVAETEKQNDSIASEQMMLAEQFTTEQSVKKGLFKRKEKKTKEKKEKVSREKKVKLPKEKKEKVPKEKKVKPPKEKRVKVPKEKKPRKRLFGKKNRDMLENPLQNGMPVTNGDSFANNVQVGNTSDIKQPTNSVNDVAIYGYSFSKKQLPAMIVLTVLGIVTLGFMVTGLKIPAIILFGVHTIGWFAFFYKDVEYAEDELLFSRADNYLDDYWNISNSMNPYRKANAGNNQTENLANVQTESMASEKEIMIVEALQEKCRNQIIEMKELRSTISDYEKKLEESREEKESLNNLIEKKDKQMHQLLPKLADDNNNTPVNIISVCAQVVESFKKYATKAEISISISTNSDAIMVKADMNRLRVLFRNIVDNSIKYMQTSGTLVITISNLGDDIFIVLKDNGKGLDESETTHIFELNYQGSNRINGNGLGLTQAKAIVEYYGGTIYAKSTLGRGMGIYIQLPVDCVESDVFGKGKDR